MDKIEAKQQEKIDFYSHELQQAGEREKAYLAKSSSARESFTQLYAYLQAKQQEERVKLYALKDQRQKWQDDLKGLLKANPTVQRTNSPN